MKKLTLRIVPFALTLMILLSVSVNVFAATQSEVDAAASKSAEFMLSTVRSPQVGSIGGEWAVIGLARSGYDVPQEYWENYYATVEAYVKACSGVLHDKKYTECSRVVVALTAIGADPTDVGGYNLLTALGDFDKTVWQGINGPIWALIALDSGNYDMPVNSEATTQSTRQMYVDEILSREHAKGGWSLSGKGGSTSAADPDLTGMALQALAKYQDQDDVKAATDRALAWLSSIQNSDGGLSLSGLENLESTNQVIVGLCELGIGLDDTRFVKNGNTLLDGLFSYRQPDGSFNHTASGSGSNQMASEQGFYGLVAVSRAMSGKSSLYRMDDVTITVSGSAGTGIGLSGKHEDVKKVAASTPGVTFGDITAHDNQAAVEALSARGIITGMDDGTFAPDETMTRAQFAAIVVRGLGLEAKKADVFTDVPAAHWAAAYIGTAYSYEIAGGLGDGTFNPEGTITRQEAATMVARAASLCGMDTDLGAAETRDLLAPFGDYVTAADWAQPSLAFCYREGIMDDSELNIEPARSILRGEIAQMLYNMLVSAKLI